ncbi:sulfite exporter TauE/SafE family protein [Methanofollis formosanus]|uniref:Probable membrane transporter protein n=1 Tax=Methanofollis formosanus TaxID=299308 RepID=A0A8G1A009_9EURY|nr:sulfite exporter TauE/SafE family protein [Methanofollis formosanus]QYZ78516.1 sulfite exporter TauE/SafE family protein [Methanofollis formosanus]
MTDLIYLLVLAGTGLLVGVLSGLLGVGGGFIMVPIQFSLFLSLGIPEDLALRLSFGTSLAVILPTVVSGALGHHRKGAVVWRAGVLLGLSSLTGAVVGAFIATHLPAAPLEIFFGLIVIAAGARTYLSSPEGEAGGAPLVSTRTCLLWGLPVGLVSGLSGIGGGVLLVPILVVVMHFGMRHAVATSMVVMIFTASGGIVSYMLNGLGVPGLPPTAVGYVDLLQAAVLAAASIPAAQVGAVMAHHVPQQFLKYAFVALTVFLGLKMIGVFSFLGIPL